MYAIGLIEKPFIHFPFILIKCKLFFLILVHIPFEYFEDKTMCVALATLNKCNDFIGKFCKIKSSFETPHKYSRDPQPSAASFKLITNFFSKCEGWQHLL